MLSFNGTLKIVQTGKEYVDPDTGSKRAPRFKHFFQLEDDDGKRDLIILNSKTDYSDLIDEEVICQVQLYPRREDSAFYLSLISCKSIR